MEGKILKAKHRPRPAKYKLTSNHVSITLVKSRAARIWAAYKPLILLVIGVLLVLMYIPCRISAAQSRLSPGIGGEIFILIGGLISLCAALDNIK